MSRSRSAGLVGAAPLAVATFLLAAPAWAGWTRVSGPVPPPTSVFHEHAGRSFLGTNFADSGDLFVSDDGGHAWTDAGLPNGGALTLFSHGPNLFFGGYLSGVHRSTDTGLTWTAVGGSLQSATVHRFLAVDATTLLAARDEFFPVPLLRSTDSGITWSPVAGGPSLRAYDLVEIGGAILVAGEDEGVHRSTDGGVTWTSSSTGLPAGVDAFRFTVHAGDVYVAAKSPVTALTVFRSTDAGVQWTQVSTGLTTAGQQALEFLSHDGAMFLATSGTSGADRGLYRSTDSGVQWTRISGGIPGSPNVSTVAVLDGDLVAGTPDGAFRTTDDGATWAPSWQGSSGVAGHHAVLHSFGELFAGTDVVTTFTNGIVFTPDLGGTWTSAGGTGTNSTAHDLLEFNGKLYAAMYGLQRGVHVSTDSGATFALAGSWPGSVVLNALHELQGVLLAGAWQALYRSTDEGASWLTAGTPGTVYDFASFDGAVYAALYPGGVSRSTDQGVSWAAFNAGLTGSEHVNALAVFDGSLYAAINAGAVVRWNGSAWETSGLGGEFVYAFAAVDGALLAGTAFSKVWFTVDGLSWTDFTDNFTGGIVESMGVTPTHVIVGTRNKGLWSRPLADLPGATSTPSPTLGSGPLLTVAPNPFSSRTSVRLVLPRTGPVELSVFDVTGRRVRQLAHGRLASGSHALVWDGRDDAGRPVVGGVYFVRVTSSDGVSAARLTRLR